MSKDDAKLSDREREVVVLASRGMTDKAIALQLNISARTVGTYWERLRGKTQSTSRSQIVIEVLGKELELAAEEAREARMERDILLEKAEGYAVFSIGLNRKILDWNPGVLRVLGFEKEDFIGHPFSIVFTPEDIEKKVPDSEISGASQHGRFIEVRYHLRKDGSHVWIDGTLVAIPDEVGKIKKFAKIMRDDSRRKMLEDEVALLQSKA